MTTPAIERMTSDERKAFVRKLAALAVAQALRNHHRAFECMSLKEARQNEEGQPTAVQASSAAM
jgi:hypothetical protein